MTMSRGMTLQNGCSRSKSSGLSRDNAAAWEAISQGSAHRRSHKPLLRAPAAGGAGGSVRGAAGAGADSRQAGGGPRVSVRGQGDSISTRCSSTQLANKEPTRRTRNARDRPSMSGKWEMQPRAENALNSRGCFGQARPPLCSVPWRRQTSAGSEPPRRDAVRCMWFTNLK